MSSSIWARLSRTCFIRPRIGSGPLLGRSYILLAAKPSNNVLLRSIPLITRQQSSAALLRADPITVVPQSVEATESEEQLPDFASLKDSVHPKVLRALTQGPFNLTTMSPVQAAVLPLLPDLTQPYDPENPPTGPRDLMVRAKTGTGKTLAFLIPAVEARLKAIDINVKKIMEDSGVTPSQRLAEKAERTYAKSHTGIVIISPTRELATQIGNEAQKLVSHLPGFEVHLFVGGESKRTQLRGFQFGRHDIVVATPGRMNDILDSSEQAAASIAHTQTLILDEGDTLLDMGFQPDILNIQKFMSSPPQRQTFLFSATLSPAIRTIARESLDKQHKYINCVSDDAPPTHAHIPQYHTVLPSAEEQFPHILRLLAHDQLINPSKSKTIVFLPTTKMTQMFAELLRAVKRDTMPAGGNTYVYELHSKKSQPSRIKASDAFRKDTSGASVLVTSDVSARGVDYPGVTRVIQVGVPQNSEVYIHRVGRTGRAGTQGRGDLLVLPFERKFLSVEMGSFPLKPLTCENLKSELLDLAKTYDADPKAFWGGEIPLMKSSNSYHRSRPLFRPTSLLPMIEDIPRVVSECIAQASGEVMDETFVSILGYYIGQTDNLKLKKVEILEAVKQWAVGACGVPMPEVSRSLLERLGIFNEQRRERRMDEIRKRGFKGPRASPWSGRGNQRRNMQKWGEEAESERHHDREGGGGGMFGRGRGGFGGRDGERRAFGGRDFGEKRTFGGRDGGERRAFGGRDDGERRAFGGRDDGEKRTYGGRDGGEKRAFGWRRQGRHENFE